MFQRLFKSQQETPEEFLSRLEAYGPRQEIDAKPVVSMRRRYVYFPVSKAANSTIKFLLREQDAKLCGFSLNDAHEHMHPPLLTPFQVSAEYYVNEIIRGDYYKFTFVRNPFSRLLSCYLDRIIGRANTRPRRQLSSLIGVPRGTAITFSQFIETICAQESKDMNDHWRDQYSCVYGDEIDFDFVGKIERLETDLEHVSKRICCPGEPPLVPSMNKSPQVTSASTRVADYFDERLADMVRERFSKDFEKFGYSLELSNAERA